MSDDKRRRKPSEQLGSPALTDEQRRLLRKRWAELKQKQKVESKEKKS